MNEQYVATGYRIYGSDPEDWVLSAAQLLDANPNVSTNERKLGGVDAKLINRNVELIPPPPSHISDFSIAKMAARMIINPDIDPVETK